ncbi:alpha/beta fold hydrolase, partial [Pseudoroseomonas deserti]|uniref:alpha/beta fold hydrolase n=1 Tax=Teichococcus deserti TaxID=1817963 RepID=UPI003462C369
PPPATPETLSFGSYEARLISAGTAEHLVIALTGLGDAAQPYRGFDWDRALGRLPQVDRLLLRDNSRSWYENPEGRAALIAHLQALVARQGYRRVTFLGVSMGAYGALRLGEALPEARVLAISPPVSLDTGRFGRGIIRYKKWLDAHKHFAGTEVRRTGQAGRHLLLFGDDQMLDLANVALFLEDGWPNLFVVPGADHNVGLTLMQLGRLDRVLALLADGAPLAAIAAAAGAYAVHPHCPALLLLQARRLFWQGALAEADLCLKEARAGTAGAPLSLLRLEWLRAGLMDTIHPALRQARARPLPEVALPLPSGQGEIAFEGPQSLVAAGVPVLGPLVLVRLRAAGPPGTQTVRLSFRAEAPRRFNEGGALKLEAFLTESGEHRRLAVAHPPQDRLVVPLTLQDGAAEFVLRRRCFTSDFDAQRGEGQAPWSMKLRDLRLEPAAG